MDIALHTRTIDVLLFEGVNALDVTGPAQAFDVARFRARRVYELRCVSADGKPVRASCGLRLQADTSQRPLRAALSSSLRRAMVNRSGRSTAHLSLPPTHAARPATLASRVRVYIVPRCDPAHRDTRQPHLVADIRFPSSPDDRAAAGSPRQPTRPQGSAINDGHSRHAIPSGRALGARLRFRRIPAISTLLGAIRRPMTVSAGRGERCHPGPPQCRAKGSRTPGMGPERTQTGRQR